MIRIAQALTDVALHRRAATTYAGRLATGLLLCVVGAVAGCGDPGALDPNRTSTAEVQFHVSAPLYVRSLAITVSGPGIDPPLLFNFAIDSGTATGAMAIPAGSQRRIVALAFDSLGVNTHRADTTVSVTGGTTPSVSFLLWPINGDMPVIVTTGTYSAILTPGDTTLSVADTLRYRAEVRNASGALVPNPTVVWASTFPWVADVDANGLVRARNAGQARIVATANGAMASRQVVVVTP